VAPAEGRRREEGKEVKKEKEKKERKRENSEKEKERNKKRKEFRKLGEILGKNRRKGKGVFVRFFLGSSTLWADAVSTMTRVGWRDRRVLGIPGEVADSGAAAALGGTTR
jgi:hypothetical protein